MSRPASYLPVPLAVLLSAGLGLLGNGLLDAMTWHTTSGRGVALAGGVLSVVGTAGLALLPRAVRPGVGRLAVVTLGVLPFTLFGGFLTWQIRASAERKAACQVGDGPACLAYGIRKLRRGHPDEAEPALARGCELKQAEACVRLASIRKGPASAEALGAGCDLGDARACAWASQRFRLGTGVVTDAPRALRYATAGCTLGDADACAEQEQLQHSR